MSAHEHPGVPRASRAQRASSFARVADEYDRGRPSYPRAAIEWLLGSDPLDVLDLGAGTGKLSLDRLWVKEPELIGRTQAPLPWRTRVRRCRQLR